MTAGGNFVNGSGFGITDGQSWLDTKVSQREQRLNRTRSWMDDREKLAGMAAESYLEFLKSRASLRDDIRTRSERSIAEQQNKLRSDAELYRERLRKYLRPELREE